MSAPLPGTPGQACKGFGTFQGEGTYFQVCRAPGLRGRVQQQDSERWSSGSGDKRSAAGNAGPAC